MKPLLHFATLLLLLIGQAAKAEVNCTAIAAFDRLHDAQVRLNDYQTPARFDLDASIVRAELAYVRDLDLATVLGSNSLVQNKQVFARFTAHSERLLARIEQGDPARLRAHFADPDRKRNMETLIVYLRSLPCNLTGVSFTNNTMEQTVGSGSPFEIDLKEVIIFLAAVVTAGLLAWLAQRYRRKQKRRARRYTANYATTYRWNNADFAGLLMDISGRGSKLKHHPDAPLELGASVHIIILGEWKSCSIVWTNAHYSGILFEQALRHKSVQKIHKAQLIRQGRAA